VIDPRRLKKWLIVAAVAYLIFPRDLVPDFIGRGLGYIEDVILISLATYYYRVYQRRYVAHTASSERQQRRDEEASTTGSEKSFDPYEVLGIARSATGEDIQAAYRARMREYHPDKVAHLGEELQKLAHDKAVEIQQAYRELVG
jgi:DnaJ like chaperone protein